MYRSAYSFLKKHNMDNFQIESENEKQLIKCKKMNARAFFDLVSDMRKLQRDYFATGDKTVLAAAKRVERQVDDEIERVNRILGEKGGTK